MIIAAAVIVVLAGRAPTSLDFRIHREKSNIKAIWKKNLKKIDFFDLMIIFTPNIRYIQGTYNAFTLDLRRR